MKKTKILSLVLAAVLITGLFAACTPKPTDSGAQTDSGTSSDQGTESGTAAPVKFDPNTFLTEDGYIKDIKAKKSVKLGTYKGITVPKEKLEVKPEEIKAQVDAVLEYYVTYEALKEGEVKADSTLNIDYVGKVDGVAFEGGSTDGKGTDVTIGVTQYIDDFLEQLVGHKVGEKFDIKVTFPDEYTSTELAGKNAVFSITINSLQGEKVYPELTDEFVKTNFSETAGCNTIKEMEDTFRKQISTEQRSRYIWETMVAGMEIKKMPEKIMELQKGMAINYYEGAAQQYGMTFEQYLGVLGKGTMEDFLKAEEANFAAAANETLIIQAIAEQEKILVTDEDIKAYLGKDDFSQEEAAYGKAYVKFVTMQNKVVDLVHSSAVDA
ncbi:MAG: FKBP-type peptidyl-prolyl cis-trans isomerase [Oscillospiraceae bacterium]